jgi:hypothetical protein
MVSVTRFQDAGGVVDGGDAFSVAADTLDGGDAFTVYSDGDTWYADIDGYVVPLPSQLSTTTGSAIPLMLTEYSVSRVTQHKIHEIIGRSDPDVTFGPTQTRSGSMTFLWESITLASAARDILAAPGSARLEQSDRPDLSMTFVITGDLSIAPDQQDPELWTLTVPFREVIA